MDTDQFHKGLTNVLQAIQAAFTDRRVEGAAVTHDAVEGQRQTVRIVISKGDKSDGQNFSPEELDDCGQAIDAPAALKVRMLVSRFVS